LLRPTDIKISLADPGKAHQKLGWKANYAMKEVAAMMVEAYMADMIEKTGSNHSSATNCSCFRENG
jgi:GDP-D-mannose dehydratase